MKLEMESKSERRMLIRDRMMPQKEEKRLRLSVVKDNSNQVLSFVSLFTHLEYESQSFHSMLRVPSTFFSLNLQIKVIHGFSKSTSATPTAVVENTVSL